MIKKTFTCKYCDKKFSSNIKIRQFCSQSCVTSYNNTHRICTHKPLTNIHKKRIGKANKKAWAKRRKNGTNYNSVESNIKRSKTLMGRKSPNLGRKWSKSYKTKMSQSVRKKFTELLQKRVTFSVGKNEKILLDKQEIIDNCKIDRHFTVIGYRPDGYCHETNTIYEVYENWHNYQTKRDLKRQKEITKCLKCKFIIIKDET